MIERRDVPRQSSGGIPVTIGVVVVAPYPSIRAGLRTMLERQPDVIVLAEWADEPLDSLTTPDVLVIDLDPDRLTLPGRLSDRFPDAGMVLLLDSPTLYRRVSGPLDRGSAVLLKDAGADEIDLALRAAAKGFVFLDPAIAQVAGIHGAASSPYNADGDMVEPLTEREKQVLELLAQGLPNKTIAMELRISEHTAKFHVGAIMSKLGAASRTEAVALAARRGLLVL